MTPAPHLQLYAVAFLARMAGQQSWWGNFLAQTLINFYSASSTHIFPQDRLVLQSLSLNNASSYLFFLSRGLILYLLLFSVFILLTFLGRKSLLAGVNKSSVIDAMVRTLGKLLAPLSSGQLNNSNGLDTTLIGWVLLFLSVCLDTTAAHSAPIEENHDKNKEQGISFF